jgi:hypothetical protein
MPLAAQSCHRPFARSRHQDANPPASHDPDVLTAWASMLEGRGEWARSPRRRFNAGVY